MGKEEQKHDLLVCESRAEEMLLFIDRNQNFSPPLVVRTAS